MLVRPSDSDCPCTCDPDPHTSAHSRQEQDDFAQLSYTRARASVEGGQFKEEIVPVVIQGRKVG